MPGGFEMSSDGTTFFQPTSASQLGSSVLQIDASTLPGNANFYRIIAAPTGVAQAAEVVYPVSGIVI